MSLSQCWKTLKHLPSTLKSLPGVVVGPDAVAHHGAAREREELSVNELQEITRMGQSRISTHLGLLQEARLAAFPAGRQAAPFTRLQPAAEGLTLEFIQLADPRCEGTAGTRQRPDQFQAHPDAGGTNRCRFISTRWRGGLIAITGRVVPGKPSVICCCAFCRRW